MKVKFYKQKLTVLAVTFFMICFKQTAESAGHLIPAPLVTYTTAAAGNWSSGTTWVGGIAPIAGADVDIQHNVTVDVTVTVNNLTINTGGSLTSDLAVTVWGTFTINGTGSYTHNNTAHAGATIFAGNESFSTTSLITIKKWFNANTALGTLINSDLGSITFDAGLSVASWSQDGTLSPGIIKGTLTVASGQIIMDDGTGMTTSLTLQDVIINGTGNLVVATGASRNLTLVTNNFTDVSTSALQTAIMRYSYGNLNWTCNGNLSVSHSFNAIRGTANQTANAVINITGNMNATGGNFDLIRLVNGTTNITVGGNTVIDLFSPNRFNLVEAGSNDLSFTTNNLFVAGGSINNYLQGSDGSAAITILNDFIASGTDDFRFTNQTSNVSTENISVGGDFTVAGGTVRLGRSSQTITYNQAGDFYLSGISTVFYGQSHTTSSSSTSMIIDGNISIADGAFYQTVSRGSINLEINGTYTQPSGTFYGINHTEAGNWGSASFDFNNINFDGGIFYAFDGRILDGRTITFSTSGNCAVNFTSGTDRFVIIRGASGNNPYLDMTITSSLNIAGLSSTCYFLTNAGSGNQMVIAGGGLNISGGNVYFVGNSSGVGNPHNLILTIKGDLNISGGNTIFAALGGNSSVNAMQNVIISGGTSALKWDTGRINMDVTGTFTQTGGTFILHSRNLDTPDKITVTMNDNFNQTAGTFNFDVRVGNTNVEHELIFNGANFTIGGTGIITHRNHLTGNTRFGLITYNTPGTIIYNRSGNSHDMQQVKQTIATGTTLNASASAFNFMISSHSSSSAITNNTLTVNGILTLGTSQVFARQQASYYAAMTVNAGARIRTQHTGGFYTGSATASCINAMISGNNRMNYSLDGNSTIEYYGTNNQAVTGIPNGIATGIQHKYGKLEINFTGTTDAEYVYPEITNEVYVRTNLNLINGEFNLDDDHVTNTGGRTINIENGATITRTNGYIRSEVNDGTGIVKWNITAAGSFVFPFGYNSIEYIPFTFAPTSGSSGDVSVATYHTAFNNVTYPVGVSHVRDMLGNDNSPYTVDRFWSISPTGNPTVDLIFQAAAAEVGTIGSPRAQRWLPVPHAWEPSLGVQSNPTAVSTLASGINALGVWWALSSSTSPLPIKLVNLNAHCNPDNVELKWVTGSETNNDFFSILRSPDGINFKEIGTVNGAGNSSSTINYIWQDDNPLFGNAYYRLRQTDYNGAYTLSKIISIDCDNDIARIKILNAELRNGIINIRLTTNIDGLHLIKLFDNNGRILFTRSLNLNKGTQLLHFTSDLRNSGLYIINVINRHDYDSRKIFSKD